MEPLIFDRKRPDFEWLDSAVARHLFDWLMLCQEALNSDYQIGEYPEWWIDNALGSYLFFGDNKRALLRCEVVHLGTQSVNDQSWVWAWANPAIPTPFREAAKKAAEAAALEHAGNWMFGHEALELRHEQDAASLAAACCRAARAKGIYKCPLPRSILFLMITDIERVDIAR